jgi:hypothetical protein
MEKWEYVVLQAVPPGVITLVSHNSYTINGVEYGYDAKQTFYSVLARLGREGWELVHIGTQVKDVWFLFFKRLADQPE